MFHLQTPFVIRKSFTLPRHAVCVALPICDTASLPPNVFAVADPASAPFTQALIELPLLVSAKWNHVERPGSVIDEIMLLLFLRTRPDTPESM